MCAHGNAPLQIYKLYTFTLGGWANKDTEKIDDVNYVKKKIKKNQLIKSYLQNILLSHKSIPFPPAFHKLKRKVPAQHF